MEITETNIEELIEQNDDPDMLKELVQYALKFKREDLLERILTKTINSTHLIEKLNKSSWQ